jgi:cytidylate kinase
MRDHQDQTRPIAPLRPAKDAKIIDTTSLNPHEVVEKILENMGDEAV